MLQKKPIDRINHLSNVRISISDIHFLLFIICLFFLSFVNAGSSIENNIQGIFTLIFSIPILAIKHEKINSHTEAILSGLFIIFMLSSTWNYFGFSNFNSWLRVLNLISLMLFARTSYIFFSQNQEKIKYLVYIFPVISSIHIALVIKKWMVLDDPYFYDWVYQIGFFGNIRYVTILTSIGLICSLYLMLKANHLKKLLFLILSTLIMSFILWSGTRSVYIGLTLISLYFIYTSTNKLKNVLFFLLIVSSSIFIATRFPVDKSSLGLDRVGKFSTSGRIEIWIDTIHYIMQKPFFGYGAESFGSVHSFYGGSASHLVQAHNIILQVLIEFGATGLLILSIIFIINFFKTNQITRPLTDQTLFIAIVINYLTIGLFDGVAYYSFSLYFLALMFALLRITAKSTNPFIS